MSELLKLELWRQLIVLAPLGLALLIAAATDLRERKVYNWLTYPLFFVCLITHTIAMGWAGLGSGLLASGAMLIIGLFILPFGWMKGGDIKLLIAVGAALGGKGLFEVFFYSTLAGFFLGIFFALWNGYLRELGRRLWHLLKGYFLLLVYRTKNFEPKLEEDERSKIPLAVAIFVGAAFTLSEHTWGWPGLLRWYLENLGMSL